MPDFPSRDELAARWRDGLVTTPGTRLVGKEVDRPGSDLNALQSAMALMGEAIVTRMVRRFAAAQESTAHGDDLDRTILDHKSLPRIGRAPAVVELTLSRPTFAAGAVTIAEGTRVAAGRGSVYRIGLPVVFGATDLGPFTVQATAVTAGTAYEVAAGQRWSFQDAVADATITVTNAEDAAGASDGESDDAYRARARGFFNAARRGTMSAIEFGLKSTPGVAVGSADEIIDAGTELPAGRVRCFVLDEIGRSNAGLTARAQVELLDYRAAGVPAIVESSTPVSTTVRIVGLRIDSTFALETDARLNAVRQAILSIGNGQRAGQPLYRSSVIAAIRSVAGVIFEDTMLAEPAATIETSTPDEVFRIEPGDIIFE